MKDILLLIQLLAFMFICYCSHHKDGIIKYQGKKIDSLHCVVDSILDFNDDVSNHIRKDFGIDTSKKVMYYQVKTLYHVRNK